MTTSWDRALDRGASVLWGRATLAGLLIAAGYWLAETILHVFVFHTGDFRHELVHPEANEVWMRSVTALLFVVLGMVIQWQVARTSAWQQRLRRLARAVEQAGEAILITDAQGRIEFTNPAFSDVTGYTADEVRGRNPSILKSGAVSDGKYREVWSTISSGQTWSGSVVDRRKCGTFYPALLTIAPITNERGVITHYVGIQRDISKQVEMEQRVREAEKLKPLGTFASGIAHDFANVLNLLNLQLRVVAMRRATAEADAELARMERLIGDAGKMVRNLDVFVRQGSLGTADTEFELRGWLNLLFPALRPMVPDEILFTLVLPSQEVWVRAEASDLHHLLINLVQNARDAVGNQPKGAITVSCETVADGACTGERHLRGLPCARLCVRDNGPGVPPELAERIFEPFFSTKGVRGTGLGLATAKDTARRYHGTLRVTNAPEGGAAFELFLPLSGTLSPDAISQR